MSSDYVADLAPFAWVDITAVGTPAPAYGDEETVRVNLPFAFPFYGQAWSQIDVSYNGAASFNAPSPITFLNTPLWGLAAAQPDIACWWDDLIPDGPFLTWHDAAHDRFVISWQNLTHYDVGGGSPDQLAFQLILNADGGITCQYQDATLDNPAFSRAASATIGLFPAAAGLLAQSQVAQVSAFTSPAWLGDGAAVRFTPCADADADGFACFDCDDSTPNLDDLEEDRYPDDCDACPLDPGPFPYGVGTVGDCMPGPGEFTLFSGPRWTGDCVTLTPGPWSAEDLLATGLTPGAIGSVMVGPGAAVYLDAEPSPVRFDALYTDDATDLGAVWSAYGVPREDDAATLDGCPLVDPACDDADGDGFCAQTLDCDDLNPAISPAAIEVCDGVDQDCDGSLTNDLPDLDRDGACESFDAVWDGWTSTVLLNGNGDGIEAAVGDVNADGLLDVVGAMNTRRAVHTFRNNGDGALQPITSLDTVFKPFELDLGDIDGDGDLDAILGGESPNSLRWTPWTGAGFGALVTVGAVSQRPGDVKLADIDDDGDLDAFASLTGANQVATYLQDGAGAFSAGAVIAATGATRLAVHDLDGDGHVDVVITPISGPLRLAFNDGAGAFSVTTLEAIGGSVRGLALQDVDEDGLTDVVTASGDGVRYWRNLGGRSFAPRAQLSAISLRDLESVDLDDDGLLDLIGVDNVSGQLVWFPGALGAVWRDLMRIPTLAPAIADDLSVGDLDEDGDLDLAVQIAGNTDQLLVLRNPLRVDADRDGADQLVDCDDADPASFPGAAEPCDAIDNDCDGAVDEDQPDADADAVCDAIDPCPADPLDDSDADGSCDSLDLCLGDDATGDLDGDLVCADADPCPADPLDDSDADGTCDSADLCLGDDATGDADADAICDALDFLLAPITLRGGQPTTLRALRAPPGARVTFLLGRNGVGAGPCYPGSSVCTNLLQPLVLGAAVANAQGTASLTITVPPTVPAGVTVRLQAAWVRTQGGVTGDTTNVARVVTE